MKKNLSALILIILCLGLFLSLGEALAIHHYQPKTTLNLKEKIEKLEKQLADLKKQLANAEKEKTSWCYNFSSDLSYGDKGASVTALQEALQKKGFSIPKEEKSKGFFGPHTASAVTGFQEKFKKEILSPWGLMHGTGFVGKTTRAKLNHLFGCSSQEAPKKTPSEEKPTSSLWSWNYCSLSHKCKIGEGDCDKNSECHSGYCSHNVGEKYDQTPGMDVCEEKPGICSDSDGGKNYYQKGKACLGDDCEYDECLYPDCGPEEDCVGVKEYLVEFYCSGDKLKSKNHTCPGGCQDGACKKEEAL